MRNAPDEFDWLTDPTVAVRPQPALAVYADKDGQITIREQAQWPDEQDHYVTINREHAQTIVRALLDAAGLEDIRMVRHVGGELFEDFEDFETEIRHRRPDLDIDAALAEFDALPEVSTQLSPTPVEQQYRAGAT